MNEVAKVTDKLPTQFDPNTTKVRQAASKAKAEFAAQQMKSGLRAGKELGEMIREWEAMHSAIDDIIVQQIELTVWWNENVREKHRPVSGRVRGHLTRDEAEAETGFAHQRVSDMKKALKDAAKYRQQQINSALKKAKIDVQDNHRAEGTGENEWFTPAKYVDAARKVMGGIDLDPATHPKAQEWIKANNTFTRLENGLEKEWAGRVWLNPPYAQPDIWNFCEKLVEEVSVGRVEQAVLLTHNYTDTAWFHLAESICTGICFTRGRIKFVDIDGEECAPTQGQAFFYYGENVDEFCTVFNEFGFLVRPA